MARSAARRRPSPNGPAAPRREPPAATASGKVADLWLGMQLRSLRKAKQMSLVQVAEAAGISIGMVSQIERGLASPSIKSLRKLSDALGVPVGWFFHPQTGGRQSELATIVRREDRRQIRLSTAATHDLVAMELLTPDLSGEIELLLLTLEPGFDSGPPHRHRGEEAGIVIAGALELWVGDNRFVVNQGDSFRFSSGDPHRYLNASDRTTQVVWALSPPLV